LRHAGMQPNIDHHCIRAPFDWRIAKVDSKTYTIGAEVVAEAERDTGQMQRAGRERHRAGAKGKQTAAGRKADLEGPR